MAKHIILSENPALAHPLRARLLELSAGQTPKIAIREVSSAPDGANVAREFEELADWLETEILDETDGWAVPAVTVFTDLGGYGLDAGAWNSPLRGGGWSQVLGLLILAFPEIHWVLLPDGRSRPELTGGWEDTARCHALGTKLSLEDLLQLRHAGFSPLFDPAGLRNLIRCRLREGPDGSSDSEVLGIPLRAESAAAIDDEAGYSFLHAYAAYRFGFRAHVVTTYAMMKQLFGAGSSFKAALVIEDIFLNFPDEHPAEFSNLPRRESPGLCPGLEQVPRRVFMSIGLGSEHRDTNKIFVAEAQQQGRRHRIRHKPLAGIFNLWEESGMVRSGRLRSMRTGRGFVWPPSQRAHSADAPAPAHSAPGRLLRVAERLLRRAEQMKEDVLSPMAAVYGAVLALDALELLADRTPTTGIQALTLKHHFEVKAECHFSGVQHHISVQPRLTEIARETRAVSRGFDRSQRAVAGLNAQMQIVNTLIRVFREYNQFDEEQECLARTRRLHHSLWIRQRPWRICMLPILRYSELLLLRITNFFWAVAGWAMVFTGIFFCLTRMKLVKMQSADHVQGAWTQAASAMLGSEVSGPNMLWQLTTVAAVLVGIAHFGLLTAHLYSLTARK